MKRSMALRITILSCHSPITISADVKIQAQLIQSGRRSYLWNLVCNSWHCFNILSNPVNIPRIIPSGQKIFYPYWAPVNHFHELITSCFFAQPANKFLTDLVKSFSLCLSKLVIDLRYCRIWIWFLFTSHSWNANRTGPDRFSFQEKEGSTGSHE